MNKINKCVSVLDVCVAQMPSPLSLSAAQAAKTSAGEESAGGENKARKTLGMVNVKQIIKYGENTTEKRPTVLRQHVLIRYGFLH